MFDISKLANFLRSLFKWYQLFDKNAKLSFALFTFYFQTDNRNEINNKQQFV